MEMNQIATITNTVVQEILGESAIVNEDLSNIVDIGTQIFNAQAFDAYVKTLVNHIGKTIFVDRPYSGAAPRVLMDGWEYGSVLEKISSELPTAVENESWNLVDGQTYDPHVFYQPKASAKFFNKRTTFEIDRSITELQVKQSFSNAQQLNAFLSMLQNETQKALTVRMDGLVMRTINNMIVETVKNGFGDAPISSNSSVKAVNLLYLYNQRFGETLTASEAILTPAFIRFAALQIALYSDRLTRMSVSFNVGASQRFTPKEYQHIVYLSEFSRAADVYLQSDVFHNDLTRFPQGETVPYWQGNGKNYLFENTGKISAIPVSEADKDNPTPYTVTGVVAVIFDRDALGVANLDRRVTTQYNAKAEFTNYFYKQDAGYFNDLNENFVVFFIA
ncbi:MAG: hypothetical protein HDS66_09380 [Bacteroidales bacterium]|nr:hypothetical protein [Bacteroidales bacterium]